MNNFETVENRTLDELANDIFKKNKWKKWLIIFLIIAFLAIYFVPKIIYYNSTAYITNTFWKSNGGAEPSDFFNFYDIKTPEKLINRKIYIDDKIVGYVLFCYDDRLIIYGTQPEQQGFGEYCGKGTIKFGDSKK